MNSDFLVILLLSSFIGAGVIAYVNLRKKQKEEAERDQGGDDA